MFAKNRLVSLVLGTRPVIRRVGMSKRHNFEQLTSCVKINAFPRSNSSQLTSSSPNCYWSLRLFSTSGSNLCSEKAKKSEGKGKPVEAAESSSDSDSDSDDEKTRGESHFWRQKMRTHHHAIDVNKDGTVSWDDFEMLADRFEKIGNMDKAQCDSFRSILRDFWEEYWGASTDPYAFVMAEDFLKSMHHVVNSADLRRKIAKPLPYFFRAVDHDGSGEISVEEFKVFFKCLGLTERDAINTFKAIDTNKDGLLSLEEFVKLGKDFFLSEDESRPSKHFWGPLVH